MNEEITIELSRVEADLARQWFDFIEDTGGDWLQEGDYQLARKLYERLELRVYGRLKSRE